MTIAPWLIPPDFIGAARAGAAAGLQRSQIASGANEAAGRLGLGYAQLAQESANAANRAAAEREQASAALALRRDDSLAERLYRGTKLEQDALGLNLAQQRANAANALGIGRLTETARHNEVIEGIGKDRAQTYADTATKSANAAKAAARLFAMAGKTRDEFNKAIAEDADLQTAAATLTGPQWGMLLPKDPTVSIPIPTPGDPFNHNPTRVSGPLGAVLPIVGTNAPAALRTAPASSTAQFQSEGEARAAGHKAGDIVYLIGIGKVRLQ